MAKTGVLFATLAIIVAEVAASDASSLQWYCHRMVPRWITSVVTPCTFPCLLITPHQHPHIVVHKEVDGTSCMTGHCSRGVCTERMGPPVLKRKKRFICFLTLAGLVKARRDKRRMQQEIHQLKQRIWLNSIRNVNGLSSNAVGTGNIHSGRTDARSSGSAGNAGSHVLEIHLIPGGGAGSTIAGNGEARFSSPFPVETVAGGNSNRRYMRGGDGSGRHFAGTRGANRGSEFGNTGGGTTSTLGDRRGSDAATGISVVGIGVGTGTSSGAGRGGSESFGNRARGSAHGGLVGVGGVIATSRNHNGNGNHMSIGVGTVRASSTGAGPLSASGSGGASSDFASTIGSGSGSNTYLESGLSGGNNGVVPSLRSNNRFAPAGESYEELSSNGNPFSDAGSIESRSTIRDDFFG